MKDKKLSAGWKIVIACMLIQAIPYCVIANLQPQFMPYVLQDEALGFNIASFSLIFTIGTFVSALCSPFVGGIFKKYNLKLIYLVGAILGCGGFAAYSFATSPTQYYIIAAALQVGSAIISSIGIPVVINSWFDESTQGKALGIAMVGSSIGNILLQTLSVNVIKAVGFRHAYLCFGIAGLLAAIPVILFGLRMPKDESEIVKGTSNTDTKDSANDGFTLAEATKTKSFKILAFAFFFVGIYVSALAMQYPAYLRQNEAINTGTVGSIFAISSVIGTIVAGNLFDKFGAFVTFLGAGILVVTATVSVLFATSVTPLAYVFAVANGLSIFAYIMGPALIARKLFGNKDFGSIYGMVSLVFGMGFALGSSIFGTVANSVGYTAAWLVVLVAAILAYTGILTSLKLKNTPSENAETEVAA